VLIDVVDIATDPDNVAFRITRGIFNSALLMVDVEGLDKHRLYVPAGRSRVCEREKFPRSSDVTEVSFPRVLESQTPISIGLDVAAVIVPLRLIVSPLAMDRDEDEAERTLEVFGLTIEVTMLLVQGRSDPFPGTNAA
jgi:hypothetical protein